MERPSKAQLAYEKIQQRNREEKIRLGLKNENKKSPYVTVPNIVHAARTDSFSTYLEAHELERPDPAQINDWTNFHDCGYLRAHGFLSRAKYTRLGIFIRIAQFAEYLERVPNRDADIRWQELGVTEAELLSKRLCHELGVMPRRFGALVHSIVRSPRPNNAALFGGKKLGGPPDWCCKAERWRAVLAEEKSAHYRVQAVNQGRAVVENAALPQYGKRTPQQRAARSAKRKKDEVTSSSDESSVAALAFSPPFTIRTPKRLSGPALSLTHSPDNSEQPALTYSPPFKIRTPPRSRSPPPIEFDYEGHEPGDTVWIRHHRNNYSWTTRDMVMPKEGTVSAEEMEEWRRKRDEMRAKDREENGDPPYSTDEDE